MLGSTVCTAQEWRSRLCRGDVVDSDNRSQLPGFSRAVVYNGGRIQCAWAYRIASKYTGGGGAADTGCLHSGSVEEYEPGDTGGHRRIRQSGLVVRLTGVKPVTRANSPVTNKNLILYGASLNGWRTVTYIIK